jgi:adenosylhomocysteine nucleosidase
MIKYLFLILMLSTRPAYANSAIVLYIVGMENEAELVRGENTEVIVSGGTAERLLPKLAILNPRDYSAVINFGMVGGFAPELNPGDVILPEVIVDDQNHSWLTSKTITFDFANRMIRCGVPVHLVRMSGVETIAVTPFERAEVRSRLNVDVDDTEVHVVAAWAEENQLPFADLGALSDDWNTTFPLAALIPLKPDGTPDAIKVGLSVLEDPSQIPALYILKNNVDLALSNLKKVVDCSP